MAEWNLYPWKGVGRMGGGRYGEGTHFGVLFVRNGEGYAHPLGDLENKKERRRIMRNSNSVMRQEIGLIQYCTVSTAPTVHPTQSSCSAILIGNRIGSDINAAPAECHTRSREVTRLSVKEFTIWMQMKWDELKVGRAG